MPFVAGETVRKRLQSGPLGVEEALNILRELATTLDAAHAAGLVHRDIKPDNVMLAADGRVVLLDFGIVKALTDASGPGGAAFASTQLTGSGALLGTVSYAAPEQALGHEVDARADQFALGVMAFELLTGRLPWRGELPARVLTQVLYQAPPRASAIRAELHQAVDVTLERALSKQPAARFGSTGAFVEALENAVPSRRLAARVDRLAGGSFRGRAVALHWNPPVVFPGGEARLVEGAGAPPRCRGCARRRCIRASVTPPRGAREMGRVRARGACRSLHDPRSARSVSGVVERRGGRRAHVAARGRGQDARDRAPRARAARAGRAR